MLAIAAAFRGDGPSRMRVADESDPPDPRHGRVVGHLLLRVPARRLSLGIRRPTWERIIAEFDRLSDTSNSREIAGLAAESASWLREQLAEFECVSVLGM